ncbi:MAG: cation:proton antiporter domain-containing protein [Planctomycetota bacterium]|jgi:NhaP-type Na+/H+ or K+/H+ antiporter
MHEFDLLAFALALFVFGLLSGRMSAWHVTAPMFFAFVGLVIGPAVGDFCEISLEDEVVALLAELALALMLFNEASTIDARALIRERSAPTRMLVLGLPLAILIGGGIGLLVLPDLGLWPVLLLAALLAPTDAALGQAVVESEVVPESTRRAIEVESGLNDGLALPAVLAFAGLASETAHTESTPLHVFLAMQLILGPLVGVTVGRLGAILIQGAVRSGAMAPSWQRLVGIGVAVGTYSLAESVGGNGFVAAFVSGLAFEITEPTLRARIHDFGQTVADQLALLLFMVFGAMSLPLAALDAAAWIYALLSLTVVRISAIALSLLGTHTDWRTTLFMGWFGPRGLASILFAIVAVEHADFPALERVLSIVYLVVGLSIVLHGITAVPFSNWLGRHPSVRA